MRRIAVVGSGVSGLTAAWALRQSAEVTLFEADGRLGGHAHTHDIDGVAVDSGFIVHNDRTYPTLLRLFADVGVRTQRTEMSMSVSCAGCGLEYAGAKRLPGLFPSRAAASNSRYLRMLTEVPRFHRAARALLETESDETLREFLVRERFSPYFTDHFVIPMVACVWSCRPGLSLDYPARYLFEFLAHHGMLSVSGSPTWRTVVGGSREYVRRVAQAVPTVRTSAPVTALVRHADGVDVVADGSAYTFDAAVVATHPDQALRLLADATSLEKEILGAFEYSPNEAVLHGDESTLPAARRARSSWNYRMPACGGGQGAVVVTYDMNLLQGLDGPGRYLVTLNGSDRIDPGSVRARMKYEHPIYTPQSVAAQQSLPRLSGPRLAFAGAYHGWGFHEDGARSGLAAARILGSTW